MIIARGGLQAVPFQKFQMPQLFLQLLLSHQLFVECVESTVRLAAD